MRGKISAVLLAGVSAVALAGGAAHADVVISKKATANMSCAGGVCTPTAAKAVLNASDLANMLASGDVKVTTGSGATNIAVKESFSWTNTSRLTLDAIQSVEFDKPVTVAGTGAVTITTNDGGSGGDLLFGDKGNLTLWDTSSSLIINGNTYTLVKDIATLASDIAANPSGFYALANDYDASVDGTYSSAPITTALKGTFEGLGHAISNLKVTSSDFEVGLFAEAFGTLRDIGLARVSINSSGSSSDVGSLLGLSEKATIVSCQATGSVVAGVGFGVGGLVGSTGSSDDGTITRSHASVSVVGGDGANVGGLVGGSGFSISLSYATGHVQAGNGASVGGLVGYIPIGGRIEKSYALGKTTAGESANVGDLVGLQQGPVTDSYAAGAVSGGMTGNIGGFVGEAGSTLRSSYSAGHVKGKTAGGFLGTANGGSSSADYWDTDSSGKSRRQGCGDGRCGRGIKGLTTEDLQSGLPAGFDSATWAEKKTINGGLPYLRALPPK